MTYHNFGNAVLYVQFWLNFEQSFTRDWDQGFTYGNIPSHDSPLLSVSRWKNGIT